MRSRVAALSRSGTWGRAAVLVGLIGVAVTQPILDLLGRNPEFWIAGHYEPGQIVTFALLVALVPSAVLVAVLLVATLAHPGVGRFTYLGLVAVVGALFGNVLARGLGIDSGPAAAVASVVGALGAVLVERARAGRMLLQYLAVGNVLFLASFLLMSPTSSLLDGNAGSALGDVSVPTPPGPVVVVILDELPLTTLLRDDGSINAERFPRFAELSERSTWFRNASAHDSLTDVAVPSLLTGRLPVDGTLPNVQDHPRNLLSLLAEAVPVDRYELVTDLCPPSACTPPPPEALGTALRDAGVVFGHRVLPPGLRSHLPAIDHAWGEFGEDVDGGAAVVPSDEAGGPDFEAYGPFARWRSLGQEKSPPRQAAILAERTSAIDGDPGLHLIHVALPHYPWVLTPWGTRLMEQPKRVADPADPAFDWSARETFQLQSMQTGAADVAIGGLIDHLDAEGIWDETTLVVVSDHGVSLSPPDFGRGPTPANEQELFRIPLFIHSPELDPGVRDDSAQSIDLLPTLIDVLGIEADWDLDGHSLVDGSEATVQPRVGTAFDPALDVVRRHHETTPRGWGWLGLAAVGDHGALVGRPVTDFEIGSPSELTWTPDHEDEFDSLPNAEGKAPQLLTGTVEADERPPELVVSVNGTLAGGVGGYQLRDGAWRFTSFLGPYLREGANEIRAFEVEAGPDGPVLRPVD